MDTKEITSLENAIRRKKSAVVAFSGGVDSATLAYLAHKTLGDKAVAITIKLRSFPDRELEHAKMVADEIGIKHRIVFFEELKVPSIANNTAQRCYHCKKKILHLLDTTRKELGFDVILEGSNASDKNTYRPGRKAIMEADEPVHSPYIELDVTKEEIRHIAIKAGLTVADRPPSPCLASRFPYGNVLTEEAIRRVELSENFLSDLGFMELRVRDHGRIARIEIHPFDFKNLLLHRENIIAYFKKTGFDYVTLDMEGFRSGSMDEIL
ncbi:ATP-dependent sacrificial sulfur transferase LarE [Methanolobus halotolerans]|uniref:TIGR00268 family protein n=1 Tax=Methanolobus halotolerans TaxID=2052935 RepID=A0A4E0PY07_9EURY|nr:ATP-dependent sacrificial sulfur transferase LarE [Methanolobus halotolerans]TGC11098.1 TIGR00268 family protein [Methanolobus halotolerans]